jgi:hypothetical protein
VHGVAIGFDREAGFRPREVETVAATVGDDRMLTNRT